MTKEATGLDAEILEILKKNLPQQVCGMVKDELEQMIDLRKENEHLKGLTERQAEDLEMYRKLDMDAKKVREEQERLDKGHRLLAKEKADFERDKKVFELTIKLQAEESKVSHTRGVLDSLVRNTVFRKTVYGSQPDPNGGFSGATVGTSEDVMEHAE